MNLDYVKPFSNTSDLVNKTPEITEKNKRDTDARNKTIYGAEKHENEKKKEDEKEEII